jgi:4-hydroxy-tetrahydrodipicolinate reductase
MKRLVAVRSSPPTRYRWPIIRDQSSAIMAAAPVRNCVRVAPLIVCCRVNPGFAMDALPIALTAVCERVDRIVVHRVQDARIRRLPFQQKIGAGLTTEQFQKKADDGSVRHVGLTESIAMIADAMGWTLDRITDEIQPKLATVTISSEYLAVDPGYVAGIIQDGVGYGRTSR